MSHRSRIKLRTMRLNLRKLRWSQARIDWYEECRLWRVKNVASEPHDGISVLVVIAMVRASCITDPLELPVTDRLRWWRILGSPNFVNRLASPIDHLIVVECQLKVRQRMLQAQLDDMCERSRAMSRQADLSIEEAEEWHQRGLRYGDPPH